MLSARGRTHGLKTSDQANEVFKAVWFEKAFRFRQSKSDVEYQEANDCQNDENIEFVERAASERVRLSRGPSAAQATVRGRMARGTGGNHHDELKTGPSAQNTGTANTRTIHDD